MRLGHLARAAPLLVRTAATAATAYPAAALKAGDALRSRRRRFTEDDPGAVYASQSLKFAAPVYVGDEVVAQVQALQINAAGARHIVKFATKCFTDDDQTLAIDGEAMAFLPTLQLSTEVME
uniref:MaoC-like domain-containing protein n=1 Tax=Aegilops tauschii TaxID=37682 RepID=M8AQY0_AEGTA